MFTESKELLKTIESDDKKTNAVLSTYQRNFLDGTETMLCVLYHAEKIPFDNIVDKDKSCKYRYSYNVCIYDKERKLICNCHLKKIDEIGDDEMRIVTLRLNVREKTDLYRVYYFKNQTNMCDIEIDENKSIVNLIMIEVVI